MCDVFRCILHVIRECNLICLSIRDIRSLDQHDEDDLGVQICHCVRCRCDLLCHKHQPELGDCHRRIDNSSNHEFVCSPSDKRIEIYYVNYRVMLV